MLTELNIKEAKRDCAAICFIGKFSADAASAFLITLDESNYLCVHKRIQYFLNRDNRIP